MQNGTDLSNNQTESTEFVFPELEPFDLKFIGSIYEIIAIICGPVYVLVLMGSFIPLKRAIGKLTSRKF